MHEIEEFDDGTVAFFVSRTPAWHLLGEVTLTELHLKEGMEKSQTGSPVEKFPIFAALPDGGRLEVKGRYATVRNHPKLGLSVLGDVGSRYVVIQDYDAFQFGDNLVDDGGAHWESMGSLRGGSTVFASMLLPQTMKHDLGDNVTPRLLLTNTHDGSGSMKACIVLERTVCMNTLRMNLAGAKHTWRIRHTANATDRLAEARKALGLSFQYVAAFEQEMEKMLAAPYSRSQYEKLVTQLIPEPVVVSNAETKAHLEKERGVLLGLWDSGTQANIAGTQWAAYNAVVEYADWMSPIRAKDHAQRRAEAQILGTNDQLKERAHSLIVAE